VTAEIKYDGPRSCRADEVTGVIELANRVMRDGSDQSFLTDYPLVYRLENVENIQIVKADGHNVSVVPFIPRPIQHEDARFNIGIISPTATDAGHRKKGLALHCLNECIGLMIDKQIELSVLWTLVTTFPFYEKGGFYPVRSQGWIYTLEQTDRDFFVDQGDPIVTCCPDTQAHIDEIRSMHEQDFFGVKRSAEEYRELFALPKMKTLMAQRDSKAGAYLIVSDAANKPGLVEGGGDPGGLETLVHEALGQLGPGESRLAYDYLSGSVLGQLLERKMPDRRTPMVAGPQMVRINDFRSFLQAISSFLVKKNSGKLDGFSMRFTDADEIIELRFSENTLTFGNTRHMNHFCMSRQEWTGVIFGDHPERPITTPPELEHIFPYYFPIWMLDHS